MGEAVLKRASVVGLGDGLRGDFGPVSPLNEALGQEGFGENVELCVLGSDDQKLDLYLLGATLGIVVMGVELGNLQDALARGAIKVSFATEHLDPLRSPDGRVQHAWFGPSSRPYVF